MSSIHYPTLASVTPVPVQPSRRESLESRRNDESLASNQDRRRNGLVSTVLAGNQPGDPHHSLPEARDGGNSSKRTGESSSKRKRSTYFPPIPNPQVDDDVNMTSSKRRHSMADVVARMRVREKTLLADGLVKGSELSPVNGEREPRINLAILSIDIENASAHTRGESPNQDSVSLSRRRKTGTWQVSKAWETPRNPGHDPLNAGSSGHSKATGFHLATGHHVSDDCSDRPLPEADPENGEVSASLPDSSRRGGGDESGDDSGDDDEDFDFDKGEAEVAAQRKKHRTSGNTGTVYQRSCQVLRVQPSPAFLRQCHLAVMGLRDVRLGPADVKPIAIALVRDGRLCVLDLSNNDLGPIGVSYIAEMLQENSTLIDLNLSATNPGREGVKALCETLRHNRTLAYLRLEENGIEHTESHLLADIIRCVPTLQGLFLGHNRLGYCGGAAIASALAQNSSLKTLDLQWNHIRRDSAVALIRALEINKCLKTLNLAWNGLGKEGCLALAHALPKNKTLRELDLTCNRVDLMSLNFLLKGVIRNDRLHTLRIGQNPLTTDGAKGLIRAITSTPRVNISHVDIGGVPVDLEFTQMVSRARESRDLHVRHEEAVTLATSDRKREHDGSNLDRYDPVMVLFEYMKLDNLRVIDMFQFMDSRKKDKLTKSNIRDGLNTLKLPVTEHAIDIIFEKLDINKDGFVELDEMMKVQRDTARQVKLRQIKAKAKNKEDGGLSGLHKALRDIIAKRKEEKEPRRDISQSVTSTKTSGGDRKASVGGLQLTQARYSVTSSKRRGENGENPQLTSVTDEEL